jgi:ABC-type Mn2+/Zn2+ transport system permease subunit
MAIVMVTAPLFAMASTFAGMVVSFNHDLPTNQTICIAACALFAVGAALKRLCSIMAGLRIS